MDFNIVLFDRFETLDAFGPAEVIGAYSFGPAQSDGAERERYNLNYCSIDGGIVVSSHNVSVNTKAFSEIDATGILLIPGGMGTRALVKDERYIEELRKLSETAHYVLTVCTGSALLAKTGLLDGYRATSNKMAFNWASSTSAEVAWVRQARWVADGRFYTSSGVSAGIDMALGFLADRHGESEARRVARAIEYIWNSDRDNDPFAPTTD